MTQVRKTATYRVVTDSGGGRIFRFYCDISGELCCVTKPIRADTEEAALELAAKLAEQGIELPPEQIFGLGPVIGAHIGPGAYGVVYIAKE